MAKRSVRSFKSCSLNDLLSKRRGLRSEQANEISLGIYFPAFLIQDLTYHHKNEL